MDPPETPDISGNQFPADFVRLETMKRRADFLACARARKQVTPGFVLQGRRRIPDAPANAPIRIGFTASKKIGNAVVRNRAKRRLRALAHDILPKAGRPGWDYVLVARKDETARRNFAQMRHDLEKALSRLHP